MASAPLKVDTETDAVITEAAHFLGMTKKDFVAAAVREYAADRRAEIEEGVRKAAAVLDGTRRAEVALLAGLSPDEVDELGGVRE
jgi:uncharacterized protein (DUF1778 family)